MPLRQATDEAIANTFAMSKGGVLEADPVNFLFFSHSFVARARRTSPVNLEKAGTRIAKALNEEMPSWVMADVQRLHRYVCRLGGKRCHAMVKEARAARGEQFMAEVRDSRLAYASLAPRPVAPATTAADAPHSLWQVHEALGLLLVGGMRLEFSQLDAQARALAGWILGGIRGGILGEAPSSHAPRGRGRETLTDTIHAP